MENDYNSEKCTLWFENVKTCRDFWVIFVDFKIVLKKVLYRVYKKKWLAN